MSELPRSSDVVITGGGAAGLAAARQLTAPGLQVLLSKPLTGSAAGSRPTGWTASGWTAASRR
jgi:glycine/D-amino acid oxidase-like deaminating enzyme